MSIFGSINDFLTGGSNKQAEKALNDALAAYGSIKAPTKEELSLPELQMYVQAGLLTPAQAQAYLQESNAFNTQVIPQTGTAAQVAALNQLAGIANAGPMGTPVEQAQVAQAIQQMNNAVQGQRGAIEQQMAAKGTPAALIQAALSNQYAGQDAQQAYQNTLQAQAQAYQAALNAMSQQGALGGQLQGQQNTQANTVAAAQNAMQQFNAANQQQNSQFNAANQQQANQINLQNAQNVANQNVGTSNARTAYNTSQAQQVFDNAMKRAEGMANIYKGQASNYQDMGTQTKDTALKTIAGFADLGSGLSTGGGAGSVPTLPIGMVAHGGVLDEHNGCYHDGGLCMKEGGMIPGQANVPGDSIQNDTVHVMASPGEAVIPRTAVQNRMPEVLDLIASSKEPEHNPKDIATVLQALRQLRMGVR